MNKQDKIIVALLFIAMFAWLFDQNRKMRRQVESTRGKPTQTQEQQGSVTNVVSVATNVATLPSAQTTEIRTPAQEEKIEPVVAVPVKKHLTEEQILTITNKLTRVSVSSWGGAVVGVHLNKYKETVDDENGNVAFDFSARPALSINGVAGLSTGDDFTISSSGSTVTVECVTSGKLRLKRTMALDADGYRLHITDVFNNESGAPISLIPHSISVGPMKLGKSKAKMRGYSQLELETLKDQSGSRVQKWANDVFPKLFGAKRSMLSCARQDVSHLPEKKSKELTEPLAWGAAKNRFFVQILAPEGGSVGCVLHGEREMESEMFELASVSMDLNFPQRTIAPNDEFTRKMSYYAGPTKYSVLKELGGYQDKVMFRTWPGFGWFRGVCIALLWTLNGLFKIIPNYGVAIILLTMIVKFGFWPITHKSTESMKKMQEIQPLMKELREKYKDKPQKLQQETMGLYKKHKVNPMASCLPMLVQMPVFIALFTVLRSAVELRFAPFLWIPDLSEPEGLLAGVIPAPINCLNILPLVMTATTFLQQKLTPTGGDPQQQKMMMFMPVFMLFIFYQMPSALVLYWSVSQLLAILQLLRQRQTKGKAQQT